jgi:hypothetical protein
MPEETGEGGGEIPAGGGGGAPASLPGEQDVEQTETMRWRQRAMELEAQLAEARTALDEAGRALEEAQRALGESERRRRIEQALAGAGPIDTEAAFVLVEHAMSGMKEPDVAAAVAQLRRTRPWLFRPAAESSASAGIGAGPAPGAIGDAAREAAATGDRRALLRYLRARRSA